MRFLCGKEQDLAGGSSRAMALLPTLPKLPITVCNQKLTPRPKEGALDGDMGTGDAGKAFLVAMLPLLKVKGEVHWYDFASDAELPTCDKTRETAQSVCQDLGLGMEVIHVAKVGSIAKRQFRICMDFRITEKKAEDGVN